MAKVPQILGSAFIVASCLGCSAETILTPGDPEIAAVSISPSSASIQVGGTVSLQATATDVTGQTVSGATFTWTTSAPPVATVDGNGAVTGTSAGTATITATSGESSGTAIVTVTSSESGVWSNPVPFTTGHGRLVSDGSVLHAVGDFEGATGLSYRRSTDQGATWSAPVTIPGAGTPVTYYALAIDGATIYVLTQETGDHLFFRRSTDGGSTWSSRVQITTQSNETAGRPDIAARAGIVHVVNMPAVTPKEIHYWRSTDNGVAWEPKVVLGPGAVPALAIEGDYVHVVWSEDQAYYRRSTNRGASWGNTIQLSTSSDPSLRPVIAALDGRVIVAWQEEMPGGIEMFARRSVDNGATWLTEQPLTFAGSAYTHAKMTARPGGLVHLSWIDFPGTARCFYKLSTDDGVSWGPDEVVTTDPRQPFNIASTQSYVHVVMLEPGTVGPTYYSRRGLP